MRRAHGPELGSQLLAEVTRIVAVLDLPARPGDDLPCGLDRERVVALTRQFVHRRQVAQPHAPKAPQPRSTTISKPGAVEPPPRRAIIARRPSPERPGSRPRAVRSHRAGVRRP